MKLYPQLGVLNEGMYVSGGNVYNLSAGQNQGFRFYGNAYSRFTVEPTETIIGGHYQDPTAFGMTGILLPGVLYIKATLLSGSFDTSLSDDEGVWLTMSGGIFGPWRQWAGQSFGSNSMRIDVSTSPTGAWIEQTGTFTMNQF